MKALGLCGYSGAGKTTLITRLVPLLRARGLAVSSIKHAHHGFDLDVPGKDSARHRAAGCGEVLVVSDTRWALLHENHGAPPPTLEAQLARLSPCDLVLVEGFHQAPLPRIHVHRAAAGKPWRDPDDPWLIARAADVAPPAACRDLPFFALDDVAGIATFIADVFLPAADALSPTPAETPR